VIGALVMAAAALFALTATDPLPSNPQRRNDWPSAPVTPLVCIRTVDIPPEDEHEFFAWIQSNGCRHFHAVSAIAGREMPLVAWSFVWPTAAPLWSGPTPWRTTFGVRLRPSGTSELRNVQPPALGQWHTIHVVAMGDHIQASLDGQRLLDHRGRPSHAWLYRLPGPSGRRFLLHRYAASLFYPSCVGKEPHFLSNFARGMLTRLT